ncbi:hypothetical protein [Winogradskyella sp. PE311]|uniref:hypothetical protein n=1 Tax=Winogradskyella sp. PE311 TaxID=3366943 RepID=UPI00397EB693
MKKILLNLIAIGFLFSCTNNDTENPDNELIGNWKLIEVLIDEGGGNGTFASVDSQKIITFESDGTLTSNGSLCNLSISSDGQTSGSYSASELTFNSPDCINADFNYTFQQNGNILIIFYPCIEPCQAKYIKE